MKKANRTLLRNTSELFYTFNSSVCENFGANSIVHSQIRTSLKDEFDQNNLFLRYNLQRAFPQMLFWGKKHECFENTITKIFDEEI